MTGEEIYEMYLKKISDFDDPDRDYARTLEYYHNCAFMCNYPIDEFFELLEKAEKTGKRISDNFNEKNPDISPECITPDYLILV